MKLLFLAGMIALFIVISEIFGGYKRSKTVARGNKQVQGSHKVINPENSTYSAIQNFFGGGY